MNKLKDSKINIINKYPLFRRIFMVGLDSFFLLISIWLNYFLTYQNNYKDLNNKYFWLNPSVLIFGITIYFVFGQYKGLTRFLGSKSLYEILFRNSFLTIILVVFGEIFNLPSPNYQFYFNFWLLLNFFTGGGRLILRDILRKLLLLNNFDNKVNKKVVIYGTGEFAIQLATSIKRSNNYEIHSFIDDCPSLWNRFLDGVPIYSPKEIEKFRENVDQILLAKPELTKKEKRTLILKFKKFKLEVFIIPSIEEITSGQAKIDSLRPLNIEDLLGRDPITPDKNLIRKAISDKIICVTGAGGSIGSELCRQIVNYQPKKIIVIDNNESSLYELTNEINLRLKEHIQFEALLGNVCDSLLLNQICTDNKIDTIFHAAAYKHVPIVENNPIVGIANNILSTEVICNIASKKNIPNMILISTDKAVRPTNIMGASKRLSELIVQAFANREKSLSKNVPKTCFSMVRFGNVLGSSGSVVPLFSSQIKRGGPITITHPEIERYFMTITEAAQLVIQSSVLAKGGDVFLLDMGKPHKIVDLAKDMIKLSSLTPKDKDNKDGDIEIIFTGLRPGEKLFEELLIDSTSHSTQHSLIFRANERSLTLKELLPDLDLLKNALKIKDKKTIFKILKKLIPEWNKNK